MTARPRVPSFWNDLPREGKLLLSLVVVDFVGRGLTLPFSVVYLHEVRDFSLGTTGTLIGLGSLVGFAAVGPGGALIDRIGARHVMQLVQVLLIVGSVLLAFASTLPVAALALVLQGLAFGVIWPASQSLVAAIVPAELRQRYFGVNFTLLNLGIGVGGIISGLLVDVDRLVTFQAIYLADAASFLPSAFVLAVRCATWRGARSTRTTTTWSGPATSPCCATPPCGRCWRSAWWRRSWATPSSTPA